MRISACILSAISLPLLMFAIVPRSASSSGLALLILLLNIALLTGALFFNMTSDEERPIEFYCHLYFLLFLLIPGYVHVSIEQFPFFNMAYPRESVELAAVCVFVFSLFFLVGYSLAHRNQSAPKPVGHWPPSPRAKYELPLIYLTISVIYAFGFGIQNFTTSRGEIDLVFQDYSPTTLVGLTVPRILSFVALLVCLVNLRERLSLTAIIISLLALSVFLLLNSPIAIPRYILFAYMIVIITVFFELTKWRKAAFLSLFVVCQFTIFPAISLLSRGDIQDLFSASPVDFFVANGDFDGFQSTINVVRYAENDGYRYGLNLLSAVLFFFPREFWPDKSRGTGGEAAEFNGYDFINVSSPLPSEFYVDFGIVGTLIGAVCFGAFLAKKDSQIGVCRKTQDKYQLLCPATIAGYIFIVLRGSLVGILGPVVLTYSVVWFTTKWTAFRGRLSVSNSS